jgi:hypothetical protein
MVRATFTLVNPSSTAVEKILANHVQIFARQSDILSVTNQC